MATGKHSTARKAGATKKAPARKASPRSGSGGPGRALVVLVLLVLLAVAAFAVYRLVLSEPAGTIAQGREVTIEVTAGETSSQIAQSLKDAQLIERTADFNEEVAAQGVADQLKVGTYRIVGGTPVGDIVALLVSGQTGYTLTIPEGYTARQIANTAAEACELDASEFYDLTLQAQDYVERYPFLKGAYNDSLEGFLFPDTYSVPYGATADEVICLMLDAFNARVAQVDMTYAQGEGLDVYDVVTLASMVEKEAATLDDMPKIASVFYNRLNANMSLGSDVTTYYAVGKDLSEELTLEDLASDSPYNTRNTALKGLPAGPICSPGLDALQAAAQPKETDYLYFFYSQSKGKTMFYKDQASFDAAWAKYGD